MTHSKRQLVLGWHAVDMALAARDGSLRRIWLEAKRSDKRAARLLEAASEQGVLVERVSRVVLERMVPHTHHQGVVAEYWGPLAGHEADLRALLEGSDAPAFLLVLDGIQDPHNLGACLRTAEAAGVQAVVTPKDRAVGLTPIVCKVASGAANRVPFFQVTNLARILGELQHEWGVWVVGAAEQADRLVYETDLRGPLALVLGSEASGLRTLTRKTCDYLVRIPMRGRVSSLNVSVAAGVLLFEALRQRNGSLSAD